MRIVHLVSSPVFSGPMESVAELALAQRQLGHDVELLIETKRSGLSSEEPAAPRLEAMHLKSRARLSLSVKSHPLEVWTDIRAMRRMVTDVWHCHFSHDHWLAWAARRRGQTLVRSIHTPRSVRLIRPAADAWTVPTASLARSLQGNPVAELPPLVADAYQPPASRAALQQSLGLSAPVVGMISSFQPQRRHQLGVEAFSQVRQTHPTASLVLLGDGETISATRAQSDALQLNGATHFPGYQSGEAFVRWLQAMDEVWILGLGHDHAGRAAVQARRCGCRVVAVDEGALATWSDAVVEPTVAAIAGAALQSGRASPAIPRVSEVAERVIRLYEEARA